MTTVAWIKLIVFILLISGSTLSWILKQLAEQKKQKQAKEAAQRRVENMLRTGRADDEIATSNVAPGSSQADPLAPPTTHADARRRLQELAERRQKQLEELRRRQAATSGSQPSAPPTVRPVEATMRPAPTPVATVPVRPQTSVPKRSAPPTQKPARAGGNRPATARKQKQSTKSAADPAFQTSLEAAANRAIDEARASSQSDSRTASPSRTSAQRVPSAAFASGAFVAPSNPAEWRRALIMREILDRPVSERSSL